MNFQRGKDPASSLDIGQVKIYRDIWDKRMPEYYDQIDDWAKENKIDHTYARLNKKTGIFTFYKIDFSQELEPVYSIGLEKLLDSFDGRKQIQYSKMVHEMAILQAKTKMQMEIAEVQQKMMMAKSLNRS